MLGGFSKYAIVVIFGFFDESLQTYILGDFKSVFIEQECGEETRRSTVTVTKRMDA
jgi:hypothetical protein